MGGFFYLETDEKQLWQLVLLIFFILFFDITDLALSSCCDMTENVQECTNENDSKSYPFTKFSNGDIFNIMYIVGKYKIYLYDHEL